MNTKRSVTWGLVGGAVACAAMAAMAGCELIVDFDRSKIPTADASLPDVEIPDVVTTNDATPDAGSEGGPAEEGGGEAGAMSEAGSDATMPEGGPTPDAEAGVVEASIPDTGPDVVTPPPDAAAEAAAEASAPEAGGED
jgi:hypothetical protein